MLINLTICIVVLLVQAQTSFAKSARYTQENIEQYLRLETAKRCVGDAINGIEFQREQALDYLNEDCEDREVLQKNEDYQKVIDRFIDLNRIIFDADAENDALLDSCNNTHCPADIQEHTKKFADDIFEAVTQAFNGGAKILEKIKPGTKCAGALNYYGKFSLCFDTYNIEDCMKDVEPVFHEKWRKILKSVHLGTNKHRGAFGALKGLRNAFSKKKSGNYVTGSAKGKVGRNLRRLNSHFARIPNDLPHNPNVEGCNDISWYDYVNGISEK